MRRGSETDGPLTENSKGYPDNSKIFHIQGNKSIKRCELSSNIAAFKASFILMILIWKNLFDAQYEVSGLALNLPVFDLIKLTNMVYNAVVRRSYPGIMPL